MDRRGEAERALEVIGRIYDGALQPEAWSGIVRAIVEFVGGAKGLILTSTTRPDQGGFVFPYGLSESALQQWADRYIEHDLWTQAGVRKNVFREANVVLDEELVSEQEFLGSVLYQEFFRPLRVARLCAGIVFGQGTPGVPPTACSVYRDISDPRFGEEERDRMRLLIPHVSRAFGVLYRLRDADLKLAATRAALDRLGSGIVLLDPRGGVVHANRAARRALDEADGLALRAPRPGSSERRLSAEAPRVLADLEAAIADCLRPTALEAPHFSKTLSVPRSSGRADLVLQFAPLPPANPFGDDRGQARAIVFITERDSPIELDHALLARLYGLTPSEAALAERLAGGDPLAAAAASHGIAESTARSHLARIFEKTGTHRQAELVKLLVSLAATGTS